MAFCKTSTHGVQKGLTYFRILPHAQSSEARRWSARPERIRATRFEGGGITLRTCRNCKKQYNPLENHPRACFYHTAHFGGETKRKFESVHTGGTMDTPGGGEISSYWHCCANEDPFDPGCVAGPHVSYDD